MLAVHSSLSALLYVFMECHLCFMDDILPTHFLIAVNRLDVCSWSYKYYLCQGCLWIWISVIVHPWSVYRWNNFHLEITLINLWRKITQWEIYIHFYVSWDTIISTAFCFFIWKCATPISKCVQYFFIILLLWNYLKKLYTMSMSCIVNITCIHLCLLQ